MDVWSSEPLRIMCLCSIFGETGPPSDGCDWRPDSGWLQSGWSSSSHGGPALPIVTCMKQVGSCGGRMSPAWRCPRRKRTARAAAVVHRAMCAQESTTDTRGERASNCRSMRSAVWNTSPFRSGHGDEELLTPREREVLVVPLLHLVVAQFLQLQVCSFAGLQEGGSLVLPWTRTVHLPQQSKHTHILVRTWLKTGAPPWRRSFCQRPRNDSVRVVLFAPTRAATWRSTCSTTPSTTSLPTRTTRWTHTSASATCWAVWPCCHPESAHRLWAQHLEGHQHWGHTCERYIKKNKFPVHIQFRWWGPKNPVFGVVVDDPRIGRLASPLLEQSRRQVSSLHVTLTTPKYRETCCETLTQSGIRAGTGKVHRKDSSPTKESELKEGKWETS